MCLLNAGHLGQTFALTATALGLGPAQTGAFRDALLAERCSLDNTGHTPLHVLAAGHPHPEPHDAPQPASLAASGDTCLTTCETASSSYANFRLIPMNTRFASAPKCGPASHVWFREPMELLETRYVRPP
ncbi:hypothetical protein GKJPGBOP_03215 [Streptomyces paromomycinus]|uniref:Nitroreductase domain-containing protein n=1 Tax=Streptomyces paromomycinus TaxID=92743 RepID=A0A401W2K6_STREY|nr:hypothetical protein GKJPGBOP_03215 [Streptomyces paromomycinus]